MIRGASPVATIAPIACGMKVPRSPRAPLHPLEEMKPALSHARFGQLLCRR